MIIFGVDPGIAITGWGVISETDKGRSIAVAYGSLHTTPDMLVSKRLKTIYGQIGELLERYKPDVMAIEKLFFIRNTTARLGVGQARGVALLSAEEHAIPIVEYAPKVVKRAVTGYGSASKEQVSLMVKALLTLPAVPKPDDVADALAVALCHAQSYRMKSVGATQ